jgi:hypothetical protein
MKTPSKSRNQVEQRPVTSVTFMEFMLDLMRPRPESEKTEISSKKPSKRPLGEPPTKRRKR